MFKILQGLAAIFGIAFIVYQVFNDEIRSKKTKRKYQNKILQIPKNYVD